MIKILLLGKLADVTGVDALDLLHVNDTEILLENLLEQYPGLKQQPFTVAVNLEIKHQPCRLFDGDEVALLPPYAGG